MRFEVRHHRQTDCDIKTPSTIDGQERADDRRTTKEGDDRRDADECNDNEPGVFVYPIHSTAMELHKDGERKTIFYVCLI